MKKQICNPFPTEDALEYPQNLALEVRNFIVLTARRVPLDDLETHQRFMAVLCELERRFPMLAEL